MRETVLHSTSWVDADVRTTEEVRARVHSDGTVVLWSRTTRGTRVTTTTPVLSLDGQAFAALARFVNQERDQP